jgi:hypothetical protein
MRFDWHGLAAYVIVARDYIERNRRVRIHMCSYRWWCKCPALVQVCAAGTTAAAGTSVAAGASGIVLL